MAKYYIIDTFQRSRRKFLFSIVKTPLRGLETCFPWHYFIKFLAILFFLIDFKILIIDTLRSPTRTYLTQFENDSNDWVFLNANSFFEEAWLGFWFQISRSGLNILDYYDYGATEPLCTFRVIIFGYVFNRYTRGYCNCHRIGVSWKYSGD